MNWSIAKRMLTPNAIVGNWRRLKQFICQNHAVGRGQSGRGQGSGVSRRRKSFENYDLIFEDFYFDR